MFKILSLIDKKYYPLLASSVFLVMLSTAVQLYLPTGLQQILDEALSKESASTITNIAVGLAVAFAFRALIVSFGQFLLTSTGDKVITDIRNLVFSHLHHLPFVQISSMPVGDVMSRVNNDISAIRNVVTSVLTSTVVNTILFVGTCVIIFSINWQLSLLVLALSPANSLLAFIVGKYVYTVSKNIQQRLANSNNVLNESIRNIETVKTFNLEKRQSEFYSRTMTDFLKDAITARRIDAYFSGISSYLTSLTKISLIWLGGLQVIDGSLSAGTLVAFLLYSQFISQSVSALSGSYTSIKQAQGASERVFDILELKPELHPEQGPGDEGNFESIELRDVSFGYEAESPVFSNISLEIKKGEKVALTGSSGCGKTTLVRILQGLLHPSEGEVRLNGKSLDYETRNSRRSIFASVPQNVSLFRASVLENLCAVNPNASLEDVIEVCKSTNCHDFIESLSNGYHTILGESGDSLSGGQKQRLAIARALLAESPVLVLDEATSSLDVQNAMKISEVIDNLPVSATVIVISHTSESVELCDRVVNVESFSKQTYPEKPREFCAISLSA